MKKEKTIEEISENAKREPLRHKNAEPIDGTTLFDSASRAIFELERFLRSTEPDSGVCRSLYKMRWGLKQLKEFYTSGNGTVWNQNTHYDDYLDQTELKSPANG